MVIPGRGTWSVGSACGASLLQEEGQPPPRGRRMALRLHTRTPRPESTESKARGHASVSKMRVRVRPGPALGLLWVSLCLPAAGCAVRSAADRLYPGLAQYSGREVASVDFHDTGVYPADTLARIVQTQASHCDLLALPICIPFTHIGLQRRLLDPGTLAADVQRLR